MNKNVKIWLIIAITLILIGVITFTCIMTVNNWNFKLLSTEKFVSNTYDIKEDYKNITITTSTADIQFVPSKNSDSSIICYENVKENHSVYVENDTLIIIQNNAKKWYEYIGISFEKPTITVSIPQDKYGNLTVESSTGNVVIPKEYLFDNINICCSTGYVSNSASASEIIKIKTSTGKIDIQNVMSNNIDVSVSTGNISVRDISCEENINVNVSTGKANVTDVKCKNLISDGSTGKISLNNVIATEKFNIERSTGNIEFINSDASEIIAKTDTGDIKGTLLTDKVFITKTDTGSIQVPKSTSGGKCELTTDTGDIKIDFK